MTEEAKQARREYQRAYRAAHKEQVQARHREWMRKNPDKVAKYNSDYWQRCADKDEREKEDLMNTHADTQAVRRGKWIQTKILDVEGYYTAYKCSICGRCCDQCETYCPTCGTRTDGRINHEKA